MEIELRPAYLFDCPECGAENLIRIMFIEGTPDEEAAEAREALGIPDDEPVPTYPRDFKCKSCGLDMDLGEELEDDEEEEEEQED
jgi:predicted nucleic acid-binding Zn ribbon protein